MLHRKRNRALSLAVLALGFIGVVPAMAAVTPGGDTTVAATATQNTTVGKTGIGSLSIDGGSTLADAIGYLGYNTGSSGTATVSGVGSKWTNSGILYVGRYGDGTLTIEAGAQVSNSTSYLGNSAGATGTATVTGTGSIWASSGSLQVGYSGSGDLIVADGGLVTAKTLHASLDDLHGNGTIATRGAVLDSELVFDGTHGTTQTLAFGAGGMLNLTVDGSGDLGAGHKGSGSLRIAEGVTVSSSSGWLGYSAGSSGTATVRGAGSNWANSSSFYVGRYGSGTLTVEGGGLISSSSGYVAHASGSSGAATVSGTGSRWTNSGSLHVGYNGSGTLTIKAGGQVANGGELRVGAYDGSGTLTIETGGQVTNTIGQLGYNAGASGAVTVSGAGSTWTNTGDLYVGKSGSGTLTVMDGGRVTASTLYAAYSDLHGNGTITVNGAILDADLVFDSSHGPAQTFGSGGTLNLTLDGTSTLGVGYRGNGSLRIAEGATVASSVGTLGYTSGSSGTATVSGAGSRWTVGSLTVGGAGSGTGGGTLSIEAGGQISSNYGYLGRNERSTGMATVSGAGSAWNNSDDLNVGFEGSGTLTIKDGAQVSSRRGILASSPHVFNVRPSGTVTVSGAGSTWTNSDSLRIGSAGEGILTIDDGGRVSSDDGAVGYYNTGTGTVTVSGAGSVWTSTRSMTVGLAGTGTLNIEAGGQVISGGGSLGSGSNVSGTATVSGAGSKWTMSGQLSVAAYGSGSLSIESGGHVSNTLSGYIGHLASSTGIVTISGAGSSWVNGGDLYVGHAGSGTLEIMAGAQVSSVTGRVAYQAGSTGTVTVSGAGSAWSVNGPGANGGYLSIGDFSPAAGKLTLADGGKVTATSLGIKSNCAVRLHVSGDDMLVLGSATREGYAVYSGTIALYADALLPAGVYRPISEYAGRTMIWSGPTPKALGGAWNNTARTFTVAELTALSAGDVETVTSGERLLFTDSLTGRRVGASFGAISGAVSFSAALMEAGDLASLAGLLEDGHGVLSAWDFTTNLSGGEAMLSFDVGMDREGLSVWHLSDGVWSSFTPGLFTYDANGIASFTVSSFSGYAVTAAVPEPGMMGLVALAGAMLLARRWA